ncbi:MAG: hypothetical protein Q7T73_05725 [Beijerinckiaceae bacterium]|nr:hypothetical protein [Beijerinckiaceae bacterium]
MAEAKLNVAVSKKTARGRTIFIVLLLIGRQILQIVEMEIKTFGEVSSSLMMRISWRNSSEALGRRDGNGLGNVDDLEADAIAALDSVQHRIGATDTTWVPADVPHRIINASDTKPMRIFWTAHQICQPALLRLADVNA